MRKAFGLMSLREIPCSCRVMITGRRSWRKEEPQSLFVFFKFPLQQPELFSGIDRFTPGKFFLQIAYDFLDARLPAG